MKKIITLLALYFLVINVNAQKDTGNITLPDTLIMPDGSVIPTSSLDSVQKVHGWQEVSISLLDDGAHIHPGKSKAEQLEAERKLDAHLNHRAPEFALKDITGKLYSLASLKGKVVVLNFWFTQCGGCVAEMPGLNELKQAYAGKEVVFLAITFDDIEKVNAFLSKKKFDYAIMPNGREVCSAYDIYGYPTSIVIDPAGIIKMINCSINSDIKSELTKAIDQAAAMQLKTTPVKS